MVMLYVILIFFIGFHLLNSCLRRRVSGRLLPPFRLNNINLNIQFPLLVFDTFAELKARSISSLRSILRDSFFTHQMKIQHGKKYCLNSMKLLPSSSDKATRVLVEPFSYLETFIRGGLFD